MLLFQNGFPSGIIRSHWNDAEKISVAPAQGCHAQIEKSKHVVIPEWRQLSRQNNVATLYDITTLYTILYVTIL